MSKSYCKNGSGAKCTCKCEDSEKKCECEEDEENRTLIIIRIAITSFIFLFSFAPFIPSLWKNIINLCAIVIIGYDVFIGSIKNIIHGEIFDEKFLMLIACVGAIILSQYHEATAVMLFYQIGEFLQDLAVDKSKSSIKKLLDIRPDVANIEVNGKIEKVDPKNVSVGNSIVVFSGEKIPLDGTIIDGESSISTSALTGESIPEEVCKGDKVLAGCINLTGTLKIIVEKTFSETTVSKIIDMVENAENKKSSSENFINKFAKIYTPTVVFMAVLLAVIPPLFLKNWSIWIYRALSFLVISCPCALVISIPLSFFAGLGGASKKGILIKGSNHIESLSKVNVVCFDKTGTLTSGKFEVAEVFSATGDTSSLIDLCALAEYGSNHPIAKSIVAFSKKQPDLSLIKSHKTLSGFGEKIELTDKTILVGNLSLMKSNNIDVPEVKTAGTIVYISTLTDFLGYIIVKDKLKTESKNTVESLKKTGIDVVMLTGDKKSVAAETASELGIEDYRAELLPDGKYNAVKALKESGKKVAFIGDGINDAPVLKVSDVGISMGEIGSDIAIDSSDVVIMDDNPEKILSAIKSSKKTMKLVKENIIFTISFKIAMLILSSLGIATMWISVFADVGVALIAILNALRALK